MNFGTTTVTEHFLSQYLTNYNVSKETIEFLLMKITSEKLQIRDVFSSVGKVCNKIGILLNGLLYASFCPEDNIDEKVSRFFYVPRNIIVTSFESFSKATSSSESIIALEESFLLCINKSDLEQAYTLSPGLERLGRVMAEESYVQASQRIRSLEVLKAKEKILDFRKTHPVLVNRSSIQIQQIASYLGMHRNVYTKHANKC